VNTVIFGKDNCPYTQAALEDFRARGVAVEYVNVARDRSALDRMLVHSGGKRRVPVIVEGERVQIGFGGT
jgi:glutaredoxin 3